MKQVATGILRRQAQRWPVPGPAPPVQALLPRSRAPVDGPVAGSPPSRADLTLDDEATDPSTSIAGVITYGLLSLTTTGPVSPDWAIELLCGLSGLIGGYLGARLQPCQRGK
jgi:hypothetical protein